MKQADASHKSLVVDILTEAFADNKSTNYVVKNDHKKLSRIRNLVDYSYNICNAFGQVWLSDDEQACALILLPEKKKTTLSSVLWDAQLATTSIGLSRVGKVLQREASIKKFHPKHELFYYLWYIGVATQYQNKGVGSAFMDEVLTKLDENARPVYLETSTTRNLPWYQKFQFEIFNTIQFSYPLYLLRRPVV